LKFKFNFSSSSSLVQFIIFRKSLWKNTPNAISIQLLFIRIIELNKRRRRRKIKFKFQKKKKTYFQRFANMSNHILCHFNYLRTSIRHNTFKLNHQTFNSIRNRLYFIDIYQPFPSNTNAHRVSLHNRKNYLKYYQR